MANELQEIALKLFGNGFVPLRIEPDSKAAKAHGWQVDTPTEESLTRAFSRPSNMGVRCGDVHQDGTALMAIDIDLDIAELIGCVERAVGSPVPVKRGKKGYTYFVRVDRETKSHKVYWTRDGKKVAAIDVLCRGAQTVVPPSIHPETKLPYRWVAGTPLTEVDYRTLPVFGPSLIDEIRGFCKNENDPIYQLNHMEWRGVGGGGNTHDICLSAVSSMVARQWTDEDIQERVQRAKREAAEASGLAYDWPQAQKVIQEWIDSSRDKKFDQVKRGKTGDIPLDIINRYVYVISINRLYDLQKGTTVDMNVFNNIHARDAAKPWAAMMMHPDLRHVDKLTYSPGQPQFCREKSFDSESVLDCLNIYSAPDVNPTEGDVQPFIDLVKDVCDNIEDAYHHVFSFLAFSVQHPGARINHALVLQGEQGIGKDSIVLAMEKVMGVQNCSQVTLAHVESQFNEWLFGKQLIVFQEMLATGRRNIYNKLKTYITDPVHTINTKHINLQRLYNRAVYIFLTNYKHALSIDPSDRRVWVHYSKMRKKSPEYYDRYYTWLADRRSGDYLMEWLLHYDTSKFNPAAPPPMTASKQELVDASASEVEQYLRQATEAGTWPMSCDLVSIPHLHGAMRPFMRASLSMITEALDNICELDGAIIETRPRIGGARLRLRAIRDGKRWINATTDALKNEYRMPLPPQSGETEGGYSIYAGSDFGGDRPGEDRGGGPDY